MSYIGLHAASTFGKVKTNNSIILRVQCSMGLFMVLCDLTDFNSSTESKEFSFCVRLNIVHNNVGV